MKELVMTLLVLPVMMIVARGTFLLFHSIVMLDKFIISRGMTDGGQKVLNLNLLKKTLLLLLLLNLMLLLFQLLALKEGL